MDSLKHERQIEADACNKPINMSTITISYKLQFYKVQPYKLQFHIFRLEPIKNSKFFD